MLATRFIYFAPADIQVARVDRQCIVSFCSALESVGVDVTLVAIGIATVESEPRASDPLDLYRIGKRFETWIPRVPVSQTSRPRWLALNRLLVHGLAGLRAVLTTRHERRLMLYTKTYSTAALLVALKRLSRAPTVVAFEAHVLPRNAFHRLVLRKVGRVVANTDALRRDLLAAGLGEHEVLATHQGVDLELIEELRVTKAEARRRLGLPAGERLVVYTGKVVDGDEEIAHLLEAARLLEARDGVHLLIVGGRADHVERLRRRSRRHNVTFVGFVAPRDVALYQWSADALVLYYPAAHPLNRYRSPGKLFEYMAAGRPIVGVDLPVLREVLGDPPAARLVAADSPHRLATALVEALTEESESEALAATASRRVGGFTWTSRAHSVLRFLGDDEVVSRARGDARRPSS